MIVIAIIAIIAIKVNGNYIVVTYIKLGKSAGNQRVNTSKVLN